MSEFINKTKQTTFTSSAASNITYDAGLRDYMLKVFNLMGIALGITGLVSLFLINTPSLLSAIYTTPLKWVAILAPLGFVMFFSVKINSLSAAQAKTCLWIFSGLMGLSLAPIFLIYTGASIARVFFITASLFGTMSIYGYTTKKDLTSMGSFMMMGVIGIVIASIVNLFMQSSAMQFMISIIAVICFTGLTAYDAQKIKNMYYQLAGDAQTLSKAATMGALSLYMDFINLFIHLLHLFGQRR